MNNYTISKYKNSDREQILKVWEDSVIATHSFLTTDDFEEIKVFVSNMNFNDFQLFCLSNEQLIIGFIGVANRKIEMLFIDPKYIRKGFGEKLLKFAVNELKADKVDVNEQNDTACKFYQKFGFTTFERTEKDDQGKNYPLLRMNLI